MLSRMLPTARRGLLRAGAPQLQAASFHAGPVLRDEEKAAEPAEKSNFLMDSLGDWNRAVPIGVALAIPAVQLDVYMLSEETQLFACFMLFVGSAYSLGGEAFGAYMDEKGIAILKEHNAIEDAQIASVETTLAAHKVVLTAQDDIKEVFAAQKVLMEEMVVAQQLQLKHNVRNELVNKLNNIAQQEANLAASVQTTVVEAATAQVTSAFENADNKMKSAALSYAMDALAGKTVGQDAVSAMYSNYLSEFGKNLAAIRGTEQALPAEVTAAIQEEIETIKKRDGLEDIDVSAPTKVTVNF